jgi:transglutaminase-like putative cysteine protease
MPTAPIRGPRSKPSLPPLESTASPSELRDLLQRAASMPSKYPWMSLELRAQIERAIVGDRNASVSLASFGPNEANVRDALTSKPGTAEVVERSARPTQRPASLRSTTQSLFSSHDPGNVMGGNPVLNNLPNLNLGNPTHERRQAMAPGPLNPDTVKTVGFTPTPVVTAIKAIISGGAPNAAELVAQVLARQYGRFDAAQSAANRAGTIEALRYLAGTGIDYDHARAGLELDNHSPNVTLSTGRGVCRDIHTATAAILASLMNAKPSGETDAAGNEIYVPGTPNGREDRVQAIAFIKPANEYVDGTFTREKTGIEPHAFMAYQDPSTGKWNTLEYDSSYEVQAPSAVEAILQTTHNLPGSNSYVINGWNGKPLLANAGVVGAKWGADFIDQDAGTGQAGEFRVTGSADKVQLTGFVTPNLSVSAAADPRKLGDGGVMINYHRDLDRADTQGHVRIAVGVTRGILEATKHAGVRGTVDPVTGSSLLGRYTNYVVYGALEGGLNQKNVRLLDEHLKLSYGFDASIRLGRSYLSSPDLPGKATLDDYDFSKGDLSLHGGLSGSEKLSANLTLHWGLEANAAANLKDIKVAIMQARDNGQALGASGQVFKDIPRTRASLQLVHTADNGITTLVEVGSTFRAFESFGGEDPREAHSLVAIISKGTVDVALVAQGELGKTALPLNALGISLGLNPGPNLGLGLGASATFRPERPANLQLMGNLKFAF